MGSPANSLGVVSVGITADPSQLNAAINTAAATAQKGGAQISQAFQGAVAPSSELTKAAQQLTAAINALNATMIASGSAANTAAAGQRNFAAAMHGSVSEIQATSGALRVLEGSGGIRAAERFLTMIPGLGAALQVAFPVIGAIALGDALVKLIDKFSGLKEATEAADAATKEADKTFAHMVSTFDRLNVERQTRQFGAGAGQLLNAQNLKADALQAAAAVQALSDQLARFDKEHHHNVGDALLAGTTFGQYGKALDQQRLELQSKIEAAEQEARIKVEEANAANEEGTNTKTKEAGALRVKAIEGQIAAQKQLSDMQRDAANAVIDQSKLIAEAQNQALVSPQARMVAAAADEVSAAQEKAARLGRIAQDEADVEIAQIRRKAAAESAGKSQPEQAQIATGAANDVAAAQARTAKTLLDLHYAVEAAILKEKEVAVQAAREETKAEEEFQQTLARTAEYWAKEADAAVSAQSKRIQSSNQIGEKEGGALSGTASTRTAGTPVGAALTLNQNGIQTVQILQNQIGLLQQQAQLAQQVNVPLQERLNLQEQILEKQIALNAAQGNTDQADKIALANVQLQQTLRQWQSLDIGNVAQDISGALTKVPQALGGALANGIFGGGKKGEDVGQQITKALAGIGKQLLGEVFTQAIQKLIATIVIQTGLQAAFNAIFPAFQTAQVIATTANTAASAANTAALALLTAAIFTQTALLGFADGGSPPVGVPSIVGERGPELFVPSVPGTIFPAGSFSRGGGSGAATALTAHSYASSSSDISGDLHFHAHGIANPRQHAEMAVREIPRVLKQRSGALGSPYSK